MNKYSQHLKLPFDVDLRDITIRECDTTQLHHFQQQTEAIPTVLLDWLNSKGLDVVHAEVFHTPPRQKLNVHVDGSVISNRVKLNWCYGANGSMMTWYRRKDESKPLLNSLLTGIGTNYLFFPLNEITMVHSARIGTPTLVNVGQPHGIINPTNESRWVISMVLHGKDDRIIEWDSAMALLAGAY